MPYLDEDLSANTVSALGAASIAVYQPSVTGSQPAIDVVIRATADSGATYDQLQAVVSGVSPSTWTPVGLTALTFTWYHIDNTGFTPIGTGTYGSYASGHGTSQLIDMSVDADACAISAARTLYVDQLAVQLNGSTTTYDFEASPFANLTVSAPSKVVYGTAAKVSGTLKVGSTALSGETAQLWARPAGASAYHQVATATAGSTGGIASTQHPVVSTSYEWRFTGDLLAQPTASKAVTVHVARKVTLHVDDTSLAKGQPLLAWGTVTPSMTGLTVTVWRGSTKLGTCRVQSDGSWGLTATLPAGKFSLFATVPATTTLAAGKSAAVTVSAA